MVYIKTIFMAKAISILRLRTIILSLMVNIRGMSGMLNVFVQDVRKGFILVIQTFRKEKKMGMTMIDDNVKQKLLDSLAEESTMVVSTAYDYAKNYVLYGADITKAWTTAVHQAAILERVKHKAWTEAYDSFKKDYENRLKADLVAMLTELQLEFEEEKRDTKHLHYDDLENAESYNTGIDNCIDTIQQKINPLKAESEG